MIHMGDNRQFTDLLSPALSLLWACLELAYFRLYEYQLCSLSGVRRQLSHVRWYMFLRASSILCCCTNDQFKIPTASRCGNTYLSASVDFPWSLCRFKFRKYVRFKVGRSKADFTNMSNYGKIAVEESSTPRLHPNPFRTHRISSTGKLLISSCSCFPGARHALEDEKYRCGVFHLNVTLVEL